MLESSALGSKQLHFLFVVVQQLDGFFRTSLIYKSGVNKLDEDTYIKGVNPVLDGKVRCSKFAFLAHCVHNTSHSGVSRWIQFLNTRAHLYFVFHFRFYN